MAKRKTLPAKDPIQRENQLINLAVNLAEKQLRDGSATSQVITHFLKLATVREQIEHDHLLADLELKKAKIKYMSDQTTGKELYEKALKAFRSYSGSRSGEDEDEYDD